MKRNFLSEVINAKKETLNRIKKGESLNPFFKEKDFFLIGEIKLSSPSTGVIKANLDIASQIEAYEKGGASAISVVTEEKFFNGDAELLKKVRNLTKLPILRKDFIIDEIQIYESFFLGADLVLLISSILSSKKLRSFVTLCRKLGLIP
ncbi:MAG: indole-3-glycerol-phosphate synthase TrpC, partial [Chloroflexi bacterium]|nr:indole-3-glycerol-phosphate synthase TrpC [Chloroflexota bacterium]